ncbi:MAG: glucosamine-6-phosphate deaminase [Enterococcus aquimarinus]
MRFIIQDSKEEIAKTAADMVELAVRENPHGVLGLATGSSPVGLYKELIKRSEAGLDFSGISSLNLDEYIGLNGYHEQSYRYFMKQHLFDGINIDQKNTQVPRGDMPDTEAEAKRYEDLIQTTEPAMIQILGIGGNGHIGFNEPGDEFIMETHVVDLTRETIDANARFFDSVQDVPKQAITMGVGGILRAKKIILIALGESKQLAVKALEDGRIMPENPSTILKVHPDVTVLCDRSAAALLDIEQVKREV